MPYDISKDKYQDKTTLRGSFGKNSRLITPGSTDLDPYAKTVFLGAAGNITYLPVGNADGDTVTIVGIAPGQPVPHRVRKVTAATQPVYSVDDFID